MSITPSEPGPDPVAIEPDAAEALRSRVYMSFAGSVAVGLAIAGLYIGGRLFARATLPQERRVVITGAASRPVVPKPSPLQPASAVNAPVRGTNNDEHKYQVNRHGQLTMLYTAGSAPKPRYQDSVVATRFGGGGSPCPCTFDSYTY